MGKHALLAGTTKCFVAGIALRDIILPGDRSHLLEFVRWRCIAVRGRRPDPKHRIIP
jgi:hypothetical protein